MSPGAHASALTIPRRFSDLPLLDDTSVPMDRHYTPHLQYRTTSPSPDFLKVVYEHTTQHRLQCGGQRHFDLFSAHLHSSLSTKTNYFVQLFLSYINRSGCRLNHCKLLTLSHNAHHWYRSASTLNSLQWLTLHPSTHSGLFWLLRSQPHRRIRPSSG